MQSLNRLEQFIDLHRYPVDRLDSSEGHSFLSQCHDQMAETTLCTLPAFLTPTAVTAICAELDALSVKAHQHSYPATAYSWRDNSQFDSNHPRGMLFQRTCDIVTTDQFNSSGPSTRLFMYNELTNSVRLMLGYDTLFRSACPTLSIQSNIMSEQHQFGWHFDTNDGVVTFMIREADSGGAFNYAPLIRDDDDENYEGVADLFQGRVTGKITPMPAGTFSLFLGRRSAHRVTPVEQTDVSRLSLLFSYDRKPGMVFPHMSCQRILNPDGRPYHGVGDSTRHS